MGIETKYGYVYYTVIDVNDWRHGNEEWFGDEFTWEKAIEFINHKLKTSEDKTVNEYKVEYGQYCDDIKFWIHKQKQHTECPVFIQFQDNQLIQTTGEGSMFVLYNEKEEQEDDEEDEEDEDTYYTGPDDNNNTIDGLAGLNGRL